MKNSRLISLLCVVMITGMISCSKNGSTGPAGPAGAAGTDGAPGATGPAGPDNVTTSTWAPVVYSFAEPISATDTIYFADMSATSITQKILDSGLVLSYLEFQDTATNGSGIVEASYFFSVSYNVGTATLASEDKTLNNLLNFRYMVVPPGVIVSSAAKGITKQQWQTMSYAEAQKTATSYGGSAPNKN